jgi:hypothetical protein
MEESRKRTLGQEGPISPGIHAERVTQHVTGARHLWNPVRVRDALVGGDPGCAGAIMKSVV